MPASSARSISGGGGWSGLGGRWFGVARWSRSGRGPLRRKGAGASGLTGGLGDELGHLCGPQICAALDRFLHFPIGSKRGHFAVPDRNPIRPQRGGFVRVGHDPAKTGLSPIVQVRDKVGNQLQYGGTMADTSSSSPGQEPAAATPSTPAASPIVVKKYANRRLYNTETSSYITLDNLAEMIRAGRDFAVYDAKSGEDITRGVLTQIIVEEESKGSAMLPTTFLRQLIGFYGGSLQGVVPRYLEQAMSTFHRQQVQVRQMVERTLSPFMPTGLEEMNRSNMAMFERALSMWNPFHREQSETGEGNAAAQPHQGETDILRLEIESLRAQLASARTPAPSSDQAELDQLRREVGSLRQQLAGAQKPSPDEAELDRLRHEVASLEQQLAAAHAAAVAPAAATAVVPPSAPANVVADPGASNGALRPARKAAVRPKVTPDATA